MALTETQVHTLIAALQAYDFPCVTFDFNEGKERVLDSMKEVEAVIRADLLAEDLIAVRDGLSNTLYWGYARTGYRDVRVRRFRNAVTKAQLGKAQLLFQRIQGPGIRSIANLGLPEFSRMSFISKVRMFLDPTNCVILDLQLLKLRHQKPPTIFHEIKVPAKPSGIRATRDNEGIYERWADQCRAIAARRYFSACGVRAVDIERAIFQLINQNDLQTAAEILANA